MNVSKLYKKSQLEAYLFETCHNAYTFLGAHFCQLDDQQGCKFALWAPRAEKVVLKGDFNGWSDDGAVEMVNLWDLGIFGAFVPDLPRYSNYKYYIHTRDGRVLEKADPFAFHAEQPPGNASKLMSLDYTWNDNDFMKNRNKSAMFTSPVNIYEVHLGSWRRREDGSIYSYSQLADLLLDYVTEMSYTHIEIMPITEYPFDDSWGYQVTGYYAPTSRYGEPQDLMSLIDRCHQRGIGVIVDWVPAHFPKDSFALAEFDGYPLYEYSDPMIGEHYHWGTLVFNYESPTVVNFLVSSAIFWAEIYHIDGMRVDAVTSMLYLDYMRDESKTNRYGGRENLEALAFIRRLNHTMHSLFPDVIMIAEEASDWEGVTAPENDGGMGFDYKWNMGWMNDTLRYMMRSPSHRPYHHDELTFSLFYAFNENFILPLSHDEVVHSEFSMIEKMPDDYWQKFANLRLLYGYMYTHPGKKLMFMGNEFGQFIEWKYYDQLEWFMIDYPQHGALHKYSKDLGQFYKNSAPLWQLERGWDGFEWIDADDTQRSIIAYVRYGKDRSKPLVVICNFSSMTYEDYTVGIPVYGRYSEVLNSDREEYGGSGVVNTTEFLTEKISHHQKPYSIRLRLPPLACIILEGQSISLADESSPTTEMKVLPPPL